MRYEHPLQKADIIVGLGNADVRTADMKYIFWDWDGTLCSAVYSGIDHELPGMSGGDFDDWFIGGITTRELIKKYHGQHSYEHHLSQMCKTLTDDLIDRQLFSKIAGRYPNGRHCIVSDKTDIFTDYAKCSKFIQHNFSHVFNSADFGHKKVATPSLYDDVRRELRLESFTNCLMIDDTPAKCEKFISLGGGALLVDSIR